MLGAALPQPDIERQRHGGSAGRLHRRGERGPEHQEAADQAVGEVLGNDGAADRLARSSSSPICSNNSAGDRRTGPDRLDRLTAMGGFGAAQILGLAFAVVVGLHEQLGQRAAIGATSARRPVALSAGDSGLRTAGLATSRCGGARRVTVPLATDDDRQPELGEYHRSCRRGRVWRVSRSRIIAGQWIWLYRRTADDQKRKGTRLPALLQPVRHHR